MRDGPADGAAVAHLRVAYLSGCVGDDLTPGLEDVVAVDVRVPRERADRDPIAVFADVTEVGQPPDVDEHGRFREPELHEWEERMPSREQLGVIAVLRKKVDGVFSRVGPRVVECRRDHQLPPSADPTPLPAASPSVPFAATLRPWASWIVAHTRSGVTGIPISVTPRGVRASTIAFTTAAGAAIVPASPI